jgi:hypothetical protein
MPSLLRPIRGSATKTIGPNGVVRDYDAGVTFVGRNIAIPPGVMAQADWLRGQGRQAEFYIGGVIRDGAADMKTTINRRYLDHGDGIKPDIRDCLQTHIFIDVDGVEGACDFRLDPVAAAISVRDRIPELTRVACVFVGSSQAGRSEQVRGKLLIALATPLSMPELRAWGEDANRRTGARIVDPALYNPVQPVYLAVPEFIDGAIDPMPERVLVLPGEERPVVLPEPAPYARAQAAPGARKDATPVAISKLWAGRTFDNDDLSAGVSDFDFDEFEAAVEHLTRKGRFNKDERKYANMRALAFACAFIEIKAFAPAAAVRALVDRVVEKTGRDSGFNDRLYAEAVRRTPGLIAVGAKIVTAGTIFHWAREQGWAPAGESTSVGETSGRTTTHEAAVLRDAKKRLSAAFKATRILGRHRIRSSLVHIALAVPNASVRAKLMFALAAFLLESNHSTAEIIEAGVACGLPRAHGVNALRWAQKTIAGKGNVG